MLLPVLVPLYSITTLLFELCDMYLVRNQRRYLAALAAGAAANDEEPADGSTARRRSSLLNLPLVDINEGDHKSTKTSSWSFMAVIALVSVVCAGALLGTTVQHATAYDASYRSLLGACMWDGIPNKSLFGNGLWEAAWWNSTKVTFLNASNCGLVELPEAFDEIFMSVESLDLDDNPLSTVDRVLAVMVERGVLVDVTLPVLRDVRVVDWSGANLTELHVPKLLCAAVPGLVEFVAHDNLLAEIPATKLGECFPALRTLNLTRNHIEVLPDELFTRGLEALRVLDVSSNALREIGSASASWLYGGGGAGHATTANRTLRFGDNPVESLSWSGIVHERWHRDVGGLSELRILSVMGCGINDSIERLAHLSKLRLLFADDNSLVGQFDGAFVASHPELVEIRLSNNKLDGT